jgi:hypothetical protein
MPHLSSFTCVVFVVIRRFLAAKSYAGLMLSAGVIPDPRAVRN